MISYLSGSDDEQAAVVSPEHKQHLKSMRTAENWGIGMFILLAGTFLLDVSWTDQLFVWIARFVFVVAAAVAFVLASRFEKKVRSYRPESTPET